MGNDFIPSLASLESRHRSGVAAMPGYLYLAIAIAAEVVATTSMKAIDGFNKPLPLLLVVGGYAIAFWMLTLVVRTIPVGIAYAIWAGLGIVLVSVAALFLYQQKLDLPAVLGMGLIVSGVLVIQLFSQSTGH
jgi:small multidrug resistance pump